MAQITIDISADSNGVISNAGLLSWNAARTENPAKEVSNFITNATSEAAGGFQCGRFFGFFSFASVPAGSKITSATLVHPVSGNKTVTAGGAIHIVSHVATDPIGVNDYLNYSTLNGDTSFGTVNFDDVNTSTTTNISFNATGIAYLQTVIGGTAKIGLRSSFDMDNSAPSGTSQYNCTVANFDLIVNYSPAGGAALFAL